MTNTTDRLINWLENHTNTNHTQYSIELFQDSLEIDPPFFYLVKKEDDLSIDQISLGSDYDLAIAKLQEFFGV